MNKNKKSALYKALIDIWWSVGGLVFGGYILYIKGVYVQFGYS